MQNPKKDKLPTNTIASELAYLMLGGLRVTIDNESIILSGTGTVLEPDKHDVRKVVMGEARYNDADPEIMLALQDAVKLFPELPVAACYTRIKKKWRVLVAVVDADVADYGLLQAYAQLKSAFAATDYLDFVLFKAYQDRDVQDPLKFEQVDLDILL